MNAYEQALADLQKAEQERDAAHRRLEQAKAEQKGAALAEIRTLMTRFGITLADLGGKSEGKTTSEVGRKSRSDKGKTVPPKYRDPASGQTWTGRGNPPVWIKAAKESGNLAAFSIK